MRFFDVKTDDLTPALTIVIRSVNGISASALNASGYMRISPGEVAAQDVPDSAGWRNQPQKNEYDAKTRFNSIGLSAGSSFAAPWAIAGIGGTYSLWPYTFFDLGFDVGFIHGYEEREDVGYISFYPSAHINGYMPLNDLIGIYAGFGGGYMINVYQTGGAATTEKIPTFDTGAGFYLGKNHHYLKLAYSLRTDFEAINHKVAVGYSYRF
jgi:hypothetical protein